MCENKCCGNCKYAMKNDLDEYMCANGESEYCSDWIETDHCCEDWSCREDEP